MSPDTGTAERAPVLVDPAAGKIVKELGPQGHLDGGTDLAWHPDSKHLASAGMDFTIRIWDASTGSELAILKGHASGLNCLAYSPDGKRLASGSEDQTVKIWDLVGGVELATLRGHADRVGGARLPGAIGLLVRLEERDAALDGLVHVLLFLRR